MGKAAVYRTARVVVAAVLVAGVAAISGSPAVAAPEQEGPPSSVPPTSCPGYPGCPPTTRPDRTLSTVIDPTSGPVRTRVAVAACGYDAGTEGRITFEGETVIALVAAGADGCMVGEGPTESAAGSFQLIAAAQDENGFNAHFTVPGDASLGNKRVCSVSSGLDTICTPFRVTAAVAGSRISLAFSGVEIALMVAAALLLLVVGWALRSAARRRRRARRPRSRVATARDAVRRQHSDVSH